MSSGDPGAVTLSFVIPARNEAVMIAATIASIHRHAADWHHEVIVVDDASGDDTAALAREAGAVVVAGTGAGIGANRNAGAALAGGRVLVFLDADVELTAAWQARMPAVCVALAQTPHLITGSHCDIPDRAGWLERYWFAAFARERGSRHVGSGHMVINTAFFRELGGFDPSLETGEDYELCARARRQGATVINDIALRVVHKGFPRGLAAFIRREAWHGRGDFRSWHALIHSRVAVLTVVFLVAHLAGLAALLAGWTGGALAAMAVVAAVLVASSIRKYAGQPLRVLAVNALVFYCYYLGRGLAAMRRLDPRGARHARLAQGVRG
ncbi:glycosyltransferase [Arhodomonas aquaeolei]|nr:MULTISPECIES: glycosyltransferase [Arhodomonas]MCS4505798.1 glycosyltransferase [Arhodomonas aquaeolei]